MIPRIQTEKARVGTFAVAHRPYDAQFPGLFDRLKTYHADFLKILADNGVETVDAGLVTTHEESEKAAALFAGAGVDLIFVNMVTYATSSLFAPVVRKNLAPVIPVALQPRACLDYTNGSTRIQLENDNICAVPEFIGVAARLGHPVADTVIGRLYGDEKAKAEIREWCDIAGVLHALHGARLGLMGHTMEAMYDMHTDPTALSAAFGLHVPLLEADEAVSLYRAVTPEEIRRETELIRREFDRPEPGSDPLTRRLTPEDEERAARGAAALRTLVARHRLTGLAYYYEGEPESLTREVVSSFIVGNSLLLASGVPMCGEYDIKTLVAMLIFDRLGIGGSFAEFHPIDFNENFILVGHDGPHHLAIAEGKPILRSLSKYHGKPGAGASVEFKIREGDMTLMGLTQTAAGRFRMIIGEGISEKGPIPPTGNTNTRAYFPPDTLSFVRRWVMAGPTHHFALGVGHRAGTLVKIARVLGVEYEVIR